jgi:hypothetical protein
VNENLGSTELGKLKVETALLLGGVGVVHYHHFNGGIAQSLNELALRVLVSLVKLLTVKDILAATLKPVIGRDNHSLLVLRILTDKGRLTGPRRSYHDVYQLRHFFSLTMCF